MSFQPSNRNQFVWEIPNFSLSTQKSKSVLDSQVYHSTNLFRTEWELELRISGPEEKNSVSFFVKRCDSDSDLAPVDLFLQLEVCFLDSKNYEHHRRYMKANFRKDSKRGFTNYIERNTIIEDRKQLLPKDKLIVQCCLWKCSLDEILPTINNISASIELEQPSFTWILGFFREWKLRDRRGILFLSDVLSDAFEIYGTLHSIPSFNNPNEPREELRISIQPVVLPSKQIFIFAKVSVLNKFQKPIIVLRGQHFFEPQFKIPWHLGTIAKSDLTDPNAHLLDYNNLDIRCEFVVTDGKRAKKTRECLTPVMEALFSDTQTFMKDIQPSYESAAFSDIKLKVEGVLFPAHRLILGARSPVFQEVLKKAEEKWKSLQQQPLRRSAILPRADTSGSVDKLQSGRTVPPVDSGEDYHINKKASRKKSKQQLQHEDSESKSNEELTNINHGKDGIPSVRVSGSDSDVVPSRRVRRRRVPKLLSEDSNPKSDADNDPVKDWTLVLSPESESGRIKIKQEPVDSEPETPNCTSTPRSFRSRRRRGELPRTLHIDTSSTESDDQMNIETYVKGLVSSISLNTHNNPNSDSNDDVLESSKDITIRMTNDGYVAEISQMNKETVRQMLKCMYTDTLDGLDVDCAIRLFQAGEKYEFQLLKDKCETFLQSCVCMRNVYFLLTLSDIFPIKSLKKAVVDFMEKNIAEILKAEDWRVFSERQADLANRVMRYIRNRSFNPEADLSLP